MTLVAGLQVECKYPCMYICIYIYISSPYPSRCCSHSSRTLLLSLLPTQLVRFLTSFLPILFPSQLLFSPCAASLCTRFARLFTDAGVQPRGSSSRLRTSFGFFVLFFLFILYFYFLLFACSLLRLLSLVRVCVPCGANHFF